MQNLRNQKMSHGANKKTLAMFVVIVAIAFGAAFFFQGRSDSLVDKSTHSGSETLQSQTTDSKNDNTKSSSAGDSTHLIVSNNAIYVAEQPPSKTVSVTFARLEKPGFLVIHEDNADKPGKILGKSYLLPGGEAKNLTPIVLSRETVDNETLYAMIHLDDGDGVFDPTEDKPVLDSASGEPVMMIFTISADATMPGAINP